MLLAGALGATWWIYRVENSPAALDPSLMLTQQTPAGDQPEVGSATIAPTPTLPPSPAPPSTLIVEEKKPPATRAAALLVAGREALQRNDEVTARTDLSDALQLGVGGTEEEFLRTELTRLGTETVLSPRIVSGDPLVDRYVIQPGDVLAKIAAANKVSPADDPKNPLGERWIGLVGISGAAVDQERYGIHGTNEPETIGKSVSMGCIRMHNEDVEALYTYLVETHSAVTVRD